MTGRADGNAPTTGARHPTRRANGHGAPVLDVEDLRVEISIRGAWVQALNDVSLHIRRGEVLGLVGESGSGKSLTALSVSRLLPDNARVVGGSIRLLGEDVLAKSEADLLRMRARSLALVFQNPTSYLNPVLTVGAQLAEIFTLNPELLGDAAGHGALSRRDRRRLAWRKSVDYLGLVNIPDPERIVAQYPFQLSGGMQQRVVIAMALARQPSLIIADEITTALDVTIQAQILTLLSELRRTVGMTLLLITHDLGIVAQLADRVAVMYGAASWSAPTCGVSSRTPSTRTLARCSRRCRRSRARRPAFARSLARYPRSRIRRRGADSTPAVPRGSNRARE